MPSLLDPEELYRDPTARSAAAGLLGIGQPTNQWHDALAQAYQGIVDAMQRQQQPPTPDDGQPTGRFLKWGHAPDPNWTEQLNQTRPFVGGADQGMPTQPEWVPGTRDDPLPPLIMDPPDKYQNT